MSDFRDIPTNEPRPIFHADEPASRAPTPQLPRVRARSALRRYGLLGLGVWGVVVVVMAAIGVLALHDAQRHLSEAKNELSLSNLSAPETPGARATSRAMGRAHAMFGSPVLLPIRMLPVVGRQVRAVSSLAGASQTAIDVGIDTRRAAAGIAAAVPKTGADRVRAITQTEDLVAAGLQRLETIELGPANNLIGPIARTRATFAAELNRIGEVLQRAEAGSRGLATFLKGPGRYAVFAANNAEMRAGSGMYLFAGELTINDGDLTLGPMKSILDLPPAPNNVALEYDYLRLWGTQAPGSDYRFVNMTPRFPTSGSLLKRMWDASGAGPVDGVLVLDPIAAVELIKVVGDVNIDGQKVTAENALQLFLHDQYEKFDTIKPAARRDFLGDVVADLFGRVAAGGVAPNAIGAALGEAAAGRHVLAWAADGDVQRGWNALGMDGLLPDQSVMFALQNRGGTKLDYFQRISATAKATVSQSGSAITMDFLITNAVPDGEPVYIAGPVPGSFVTKANVYTGIASVNVPAIATDVQFIGGDLANGDFDLVKGPDGNTQVVSKWLQIDQGETVRLHLSFALPPSYRSLVVMPSVRHPGVFWHLGKTTWTDFKPREIRW